MESIPLAVNGTLMRGLELNHNMLRAGATFVREDRTAACYRLFTIDDVHPAMQRVAASGAQVSLEVWNVPLASLAGILLQEPPGLCVGKVTLADASVVLGVVGESLLCERGLDITDYGGWRQYLASKRCAVSAPGDPSRPLPMESLSPALRVAGRRSHG